MEYLCKNCFLRFCNGDCPIPAHVRRLLKDTDIFQMSNTSFMCQTVNNVIAEETKKAKEKAGKPTRLCRECSLDCGNPILIGGAMSKNSHCKKLTVDLNNWIDDISNKKVKG